MEGGFIVSSWIFTCAANRDIIQMWRTHTRGSAAYGSAAVRFARRSGLYVLLLDHYHATDEYVLSAVV